MDQWTSKSINLVFENKTVDLNNCDYVADKTHQQLLNTFVLKLNI